MASIREVEWEPCLLEPHRDDALERKARATLGREASALRYWTDLPWFANALVDFQSCLMTRTHLDQDLADLVGLTVSQDNSCRYCFAITRAFLLLLGHSQRRIAQLEQQLVTSEFSPRERAAFEFARRLSRSNPLLTRTAREPLEQAGFDDATIMELTAQVALNVFFNRISTLPALPPGRMEAVPERWTTWLMRPFLRPMLRRYRRTGTVVRLSEAQRQGPFAGVVNAFDGLEFALVLRRALDALWASPVLPGRTKALVFAVVARTLDCPYSEQEAARLVRAEGIDEATAERVLAHLDAPSLSEVERVVLPFARETVWYQPAAIQRRARELREIVGLQPFLEVIAATALANTICRLGCVATHR